MKRKIFTAALVFAITGSLTIPHCPYIFVSADEYTDGYGYDDLDEDGATRETGDSLWPEVYDPSEDKPIYIPGDDTEDVDIPLFPDDIEISPSNKKIGIGSEFSIEILQEDPDFWEEYDDDVWGESNEKYIESIDYKSKKSYVAKVNAGGVVKGKHKGSTVIITTVYFKSGAKKIGKTKVRVKK